MTAPDLGSPDQAHPRFMALLRLGPLDGSWDTAPAALPLPKSLFLGQAHLLTTCNQLLLSLQEPYSDLAAEVLRLDLLQCV